MKHKTRVKIPASEVLEWLMEHHPALHEVAELDRAWVWLPVDLRQMPEARKSLLDYGFKFAHYGHPLPSGHIGTYGHSCDAPTRFKRRGNAGRKQGANETRDSEAVGDDTAPTLDVDQIAAAFL